MKITVLGATGLTGLLVVQQALDLGHSVTAYARRPGTLARTRTSGSSSATSTTPHLWRLPFATPKPSSPASVHGPA